MPASVMKFTPVLAASLAVSAFPASAASDDYKYQAPPAAGSANGYAVPIAPGGQPGVLGGGGYTTPGGTSFQG